MNNYLATYHFLIKIWSFLRQKSINREMFIRHCRTEVTDNVPLISRSSCQRKLSIILYDYTQNGSSSSWILGYGFKILWCGLYETEVLRPTSMTLIKSSIVRLSTCGSCKVLEDSKLGLNRTNWENSTNDDANGKQTASKIPLKWRLSPFSWKQYSISSFQKSGSVTFVPLRSANIMQKIYEK